MKERFKNYRRDVGDTIMNSYYILRGRMLAYLIDLLINQLNTTGRDITQWQVLKTIKQCIISKNKNFHITCKVLMSTYLQIFIGNRIGIILLKIYFRSC